MLTLKTSPLIYVFLCSYVVQGKYTQYLQYIQHTFSTMWVLTHPQDVQVSQSRASLPRCLQPLASGRQMSLVQLCPEVVRRHHHYHHHHYYSWWKKSQTTWDVWNLVNKGISYPPTGAGFIPSTVRLWLITSLTSKDDHKLRWKRPW